MYYYLDKAQAQIGRVLLVAKSDTRIPNPDSLFGKDKVVELIADSLPFAVVYDSDNNVVRAATVEERKANSMKRLYAGLQLLGKVWTKDDFNIDTFIKREGDTVLGTLNMIGEIPIRLPYNKPVLVYKTDGSSVSVLKSVDNNIILSEGANKAIISNPCDINGNLNVTGVISATGDVVGMSDRRIKKNITNINNTWDIINNLRGVKYILRKDNTKHIGLIAQEVEEVLPEVVYTDKDTGYKAIAYGNLAGLFIEALKDIKTRLDKIEGGGNK